LVFHFHLEAETGTVRERSSTVPKTNQRIHNYEIEHDSLHPCLQTVFPLAVKLAFYIP
jgi:hypothetical protein